MKFFRKPSRNNSFALALMGALAAAVPSIGVTAAEAEKPGQACGKAALAERDYHTCEGARLRAKGLALEAQARAQVTRGRMMGTQCGRQQDEAAARDCGLISSDLLEDSAFKHAEAADILNEAGRMEERAADLSKAQPKP